MYTWSYKYKQIHESGLDYSYIFPELFFNSESLCNVKRKAQQVPAYTHSNEFLGMEHPLFSVQHSEKVDGQDFHGLLSESYEPYTQQERLYT